MIQLPIREVADYISEVARTAPKYPMVLGSQLGSSVAKRFPGFKGLKDFITQHCQGRLRIHSNFGGDVLYESMEPRLDASTELSPDEAKSSPDSKTPPARSTLVQAGRSQSAIYPSPTPWQAFTNPNSSHRILIDPETSSISTLNSNEQPEPPKFVIQSLTNDDHKQIASTFMPSVANDDRSTFEKLLSERFSSRDWFVTIKNYADGKYNAAWADFRKTAILQRLKLELLTRVSEEIAEALVSTFLKSRSIQRQNSLFEASKSNFRLQNTPNTRPSLRQIALRAVALMDNEELLSIRVSLRIVKEMIDNR